MNNYGLSELSGVRPGSGEKKIMIMVIRICQEPGLAPVNQKMKHFGLPELSGARPGSGEPKMRDNG